MDEPSDREGDKLRQRDQFIGLEERALRKSYFPLLQQQVDALNATKLSLERKAEELEAMRQRAEESEAAYRELFDKSSEALIVHDANCFRIYEVNEAFCELYGYSREEARQLTIEDISALDIPSDEIAQRVAGAIHEGTLRFEWTARRKDGSTFWADVTLKSARISGELRVIVTVRDITRRKEAEAAVIEANRRLEEKVAERTRNLATANQDLSNLLLRLQSAQKQIVQSEKLAALGALVAGVSHELNTPIGNALLLASTLDDARRAFEEASMSGLRKAHLAAFQQELAEGFGSMLASLHRAAELIASFKELAVDQASSRRRVFDLREVTNETVTALAPALRHAGVGLRNEIGDGIILDSYPGPLGQVLGNLINNAIKHGFDGMTGGEIVIGTRRTEIGMVEIALSDNGHGIPEQHLSKVFDPFFTTKLGQGGSGLGLHIVYNIVVGVLGGSIRLESAAGQGARFVINLPLVAKRAGTDDMDIEAEE